MADSGDVCGFLASEVMPAHTTRHHGPMTDNRLFIYGSLAPGRPNEHVMRPLGGVWQRGTVVGDLEERGWGAASGFPGIVVNRPSENRVEGWLLTADTLRENWAQLDEFEGSEYQRVSGAVTLDDNTQVEAWIYALAD